MVVVKKKRTTLETDIEADLKLKGAGKYQIDTGIGFLDHMLQLWCKHGFFDLQLKAQGDLEIDAHHTAEDTGLLLGQMLNEALDERKGICRYGQVILPMDETLVLTALDLGGRPYYNDNLKFDVNRVGDFPVTLVGEFFRALTNQADINLHFKMLSGGNAHHLIEACFKGFGRAFDKALECEKRLDDSPLSTKGQLKEGE